ncbi:MAG: hypothetical protein ACR2OC_11745 [Solirubrobacterales bacterium]
MVWRALTGRRIATALVAAASIFLAASASASAAFSISTYQQKKTRVTSQGVIWIDDNCSGCSGKATITGAGKGKQPVLGTGSLEDDHFEYGIPVKLKKPALKQIEKAGSMKIAITVKASGGNETGSDSLRAKALAPLDFADPCEVITQAEVEHVLAGPADPPQFGKEAAEPEIDQFGCGWGRTDFSRVFGLTTTRGDFAVEFFAGPATFFDTMTTVPGPWDDAVLYDSAEDTAQVFQAIRGDDLVSMAFHQDAAERAISVAPAVLDSYPGS